MVRHWWRGRYTAAIVAIYVAIVGFALPLQKGSAADPPVTQPFQQAKTNVTALEQRALGLPPRPLEAVIGNLIQSALSLLGVFFFGYMVWAGYLWMTARGEEEQITKAKKMLSNAIIGLAITLGAYAISIFVVSRLTVSAGIGS